LVTIYTDGAARGNPGPGAYAAFLTYNGHCKAISQAFRKTTNNRMELWAVIAGLDALTKQQQKVTIVSDSRYVVDALQKGWLMRWLKNNFQNKKNSDLWKKFLSLYQKHTIQITWVKGHSGHLYNEKCDQLANECLDNGPWAIDHIYETNAPENTIP